MALEQGQLKCWLWLDYPVSLKRAARLQPPSLLWLGVPEAKIIA